MPSVEYRLTGEASTPKAKSVGRGSPLKDRLHQKILLP